MPAPRPPGWRHAHLRFRDADWQRITRYAEGLGIPIAVALRELALHALTEEEKWFQLSQELGRQ